MKRVSIGLLLMALPVLVVHWARQSDWGAALTAPQARQKGPSGATVTIVEYSDFQCPACARIQPDVKRLLELYPTQVKLVFKHYPLTRIHANAQPAAQAAECAAAQNKFWPYHDKLYENQPAWASLPDATTAFFQFARDVGIDETRFSACVASGETRAAVQADAEEAVRRQVQSTPTFFVGETRLVGGYLASDGARTIEKEMRR